MKYSGYTRPKLTVDGRESTVPKKPICHSTVQSGLLNAMRLMGLQAIVVIFIALVWGLSGFSAMFSTRLGGVVCILPNSYCAHRFFASGRKNKGPNKIVYAFYKGELVKLMMTAGLALIIFLAFHIKILPFLSGFIGATIGMWLAPLLAMFKRDARVSQA